MRIVCRFTQLENSGCKIGLIAIYGKQADIGEAAVRLLHMSDVVQGYRSLKDKTIHRPHPSWAADENHSAFGFADWSLVSGWNSPSYIMLQRDSQQEGVQDSHHGNMLMVCIQNKVCTD